MAIEKERLFPYILLIITCLLWGLAWAVGRLLAVQLPPISTAVIRYTIVVLLFFMILKSREKSISIPKEWLKPFFLMGLFSVALYQAFFLFGVKYTAASDASLVIGVGPVLIAFMAALFLKEKLTKEKVLGLILGFSGIAIISYFSPNISVENRFLGDLLVFGGALVYAIYTILLRDFQIKNRGRNPSSLLIIAWVSFLGWLIMVPFAFLEQPWNYTWTSDAWLEIAYLAIFSTVIAYWLYVEAVSRIGAGNSAIFLNLVPVFGVLSSAVILSEIISIWHLASFILVFAGVWIANRSR
ncbi:MAG: DMT family transporter [Candidatus Aenigmarchaeota archaeon]|nr:DMT family transporter [Candidatus Aenigmarchaeota archaeon]